MNRVEDLERRIRTLETNRQIQLASTSGGSLEIHDLSGNDPRVSFFLHTFMVDPFPPMTQGYELQQPRLKCASVFVLSGQYIKRTANVSNFFGVVNAQSFEGPPGFILPGGFDVPSGIASFSFQMLPDYGTHPLRW
jgi:hypothetical protein